MNKAELLLAVEAALNGDWEKSHKIAQEYADPSANWIHAVLHKMEGDQGNSQYWYAKTAGKKYEDFTDVNQELKAIQASLM